MTPSPRTHHWLATIVGQMTLTNIGFYAVLAILALHLTGPLGYSPTLAAFMMGAYTIGLRAMRLVLAPWLNRIPARQAILGATALLALTYAALGYATSPWLVAPLLLLLGTGYGANGLLTTTLMSHIPNPGKTHLSRYAILYTGTNLAAALGPLAGNSLRLHTTPEAPFLLAAAIITLNLVLSVRWLPHDLPSHPEPENTGWWSQVATLWQNPAMRRVMLLTAMGWMLYSHKYSALPLFAEHTLSDPALVGRLLSLTAIIILSLSLPLSRLYGRLELPSPMVSLLGFALYAAGFALAWASPTLPFAYTAVTLWAVAEATLMPSLNSAVADHLPPNQRLVGFALNALAIAAGEGLGNLLGIIAGSTGQAYPLFLVLSLCVIAIGAYIQPRKVTP